jgi:hypothetical protein
MGGDSDSVSGRGCAPSAAVVVAVDGGTVARTTAAPDGSFSADFVAPDRPIGRHNLTATCGNVVLATPLDYVGPANSASGGALPLTILGVLLVVVLLGIPVLRRGFGVGNA